MYNKDWRRVLLFFMLFVPALVSAQSSLSDLFEGNGTKESPFLIKTAQDLVALSNYCNNGGSTVSGGRTVYFKQMEDIDMNDLTDKEQIIVKKEAFVTETHTHIETIDTIVTMDTIDMIISHYKKYIDHIQYNYSPWYEQGYTLSDTRDTIYLNKSGADTNTGLTTNTVVTISEVTSSNENLSDSETETQSSTNNEEMLRDFGWGNVNTYNNIYSWQDTTITGTDSTKIVYYKNDTTIETRRQIKKYTTITKTIKDIYTYEYTYDYDTLYAYNFTPIKDFKGRFDGNGRVISNLVVYQPNSTSVGLFANAGYRADGLPAGVMPENSFAAIEGVGLVNPYVVGNGGHTGSIVGTASSIQYVKNCWAKGGLIMGAGEVGGIVGDINNGNNDEVGTESEHDASGKIISCYTNGTKIILTGCNVGPGAGGIVGGLHYKLHSCYSTAKIKVVSNCPTSSNYFISPIGNNQSENFAVNDVYYLADWNDNEPPLTINGLAYVDTAREVATEDALKDSVLANLDGFYRDDEFDDNGGLPINHPRWVYLDSLRRNAAGPEFNIYVKHWNLVATTQADATFDILKYNEVKDGTPEGDKNLDVAASKYDYYQNMWWAVNWLLRYDPMDKGNGYFIWPYDKDTLQRPVTIPISSDSIMTWTQSANIMGDFDVSLNNTGSGDPWFALGNSYGSTLYLKPFKEDNSAIIQGEYAYTYNAKKEQWKTIAFDTGAVASVQGFMVAGQTNNITVHYKESNQTTRPTTSKVVTDISQMSFVASSTEESAIEKTALIRMQADAENTFDAKDSYIMLSTARNDLVEPYFVVEDKPLYSNVFKSLPYTTAFNLHAGRDTYAKLSVKDVPENINVVLIDREDDSETVLGEEPIVLQLSQGENTDRFTVRFEYKNVSLEQNATFEDININLYANTLYISGTNLQNLEIYSVDGKKVFDKALFGDNDQTDLHLANGVYIVKAKSKTNTCTKKIVVNK